MTCRWCEGEHASDACPAVLRREYYPSGALRLVELADRGLSRELPETVSIDRLKQYAGGPPFE